MDSLLRPSHTRNEHDAAMGRFLLVLSAILRSAERSTLRGGRSGALLDEWRQARWCRSLRRRNGARGAASFVCPVLAQGAFRPWLLVETGAVSAIGEPGNYSRRR